MRHKKTVNVKEKKESILDLFDETNLDDLPEECTIELKYGKGTRYIPEYANMLELFKLTPGEISLNMMVVAYYRKFKEVIKRTKVQEGFANLKNKGLIEYVGNTRYRYIGK